MKKIVFYNHFNNGDIHISRSFVRFLIDKVKPNMPDVDFVYAHKNDAGLLSDISGLSYDRSCLDHVTSHYNGVEEHHGNVYINTWYGSERQRHMNKYGVTFDCLYSVMDSAARKVFNFSLDDQEPTQFFPNIDYVKFHISHAEKFVTDLHKFSNKMILVANGPAKSGQSADFNLSQVILELSKKYKGLVFVLSDKSETIVNNDNIFYSQDIIKKPQGSDLNENSYLSLHSDMIVGRSSGVFSFSFVGDNLFKRKIDFVSFSNLSSGSKKYWLSDRFQSRIDYNSRIFDVNLKTSDAALEFLNKKIREKYIER